MRASARWKGAPPGSRKWASPWVSSRSSRRRTASRCRSRSRITTKAWALPSAFGTFEEVEVAAEGGAGSPASADGKLREQVGGIQFSTGEDLRDAPGARPVVKAFERRQDRQHPRAAHRRDHLGVFLCGLRLFRGSRGEDHAAARHVARRKRLEREQ